MHRDQVQGWLWPDLDATAAANNNLHKNLHFLRAVLAQYGVAGVVSLTSDLVVLASDVWIDAEAFRALAHQARAAANDIGLFEQALALYAGDLLPEDIYEDWAASPREELRSLRQQLLLDLARLREALGTPERAIERLQQVVAAEPLHEEAHRALMRVYARLGRRHQALRQYQLCREVLDRELGIDPSDETEALQHSILEGSDELLLQPAAPATTQASVASDRRASPSPLPPLYGRERELELIDELLEFGAAGMAQVLFIQGPAGIGKSRLAEQALAVAEERYGSVALVGRSYELDEPISYRPLRLVLQQAATMPIEHPRVEEVLRTSLCLRRLLPGSEASALAAVDPAVLQLELFDEMVRLLSALASPGRPLALLFDDLHAADEASLRVVHHLCRKLHEARTASVVLATYRTSRPPRRAAIACWRSSWADCAGTGWCASWRSSRWKSRSCD
jgi:DNA-binding SARP family transcriptional activator